MKKIKNNSTIKFKSPTPDWSGRIMIEVSEGHDIANLLERGDIIETSEGDFIIKEISKENIRMKFVVEKYPNAKTIEFKIINGLPEDHSIDVFKNNKVHLQILHLTKWAEISCNIHANSFQSTICFLMGFLTGKIVDDIKKADCNVKLTIEEID